MVATMDPNLDSASSYFLGVEMEGSIRTRKLSATATDSIDNCFRHGETEVHNEAMVRSVAMSANIASTVKDEVKHLIRINTFDSNSFHENSSSGIASSIEGDQLHRLHTISKAEYHPVNVPSLHNSCSHILLPLEENIISAIVLSKWDDIMGPQTVHVWLQENTNPGQEGSQSVQEGSGTDNLSMCIESKSSRQTACSHEWVDRTSNLMKAIKYVTSHTVSYTGASMFSSTSKNSNLFVVPDLKLVAQSLVFHATVPFSLAVLVGHAHYHDFLHLRRLCHQWLLRMATRLKVMLSSGGLESHNFVRVNQWVLELCHTLISLRACGLGTSTLACSAEVLGHPLLERALTSHLQTFGCTVVMGTSSTDINTLIALLALFLDTDERFCSRLVLPVMKYSFNVGLFLQGLLMDEFGCRELCSDELAANPYPVTAVDLTRGIQPSAVKQTPPHLCRQEWEWDDSHTRSRHGSILHPVKESACLVKALLRDMKCMPPSHWQAFIDLFMKKINCLAHALLCLTHSLGSKECSQQTACVERRIGGNAASRQRLLMRSLDLHEGDFLVVLAAAEKLKPGVYSYVMELDVDCLAR